jgi:hypothetical protein
MDFGGRLMVGPSGAEPLTSTMSKWVVQNPIYLKKQETNQIPSLESQYSQRYASQKNNDRY